MNKTAAMRASIKRMAAEAESKKKTRPAPKESVATPPRPNTRLPGGSKFEAAYTAVTETDGYWDCTLTVLVGGVAEKWHTRVNGIMASFPRLDRMYRAWIKAKQS